MLRRVMKDMEEVWPHLWDWHGTCLQWLRENMRNVNLESRSPDRDLNLWSVEYEAGVLNTRPPRLVINIILSRGKCFGLIIRFIGLLYTQLVTTLYKSLWHRLECSQSQTSLRCLVTSPNSGRSSAPGITSLQVGGRFTQTSYSSNWILKAIL
jgi:hypothetical protein